MENIDYLAQLGGTLAFALTMTQVLKPGVKTVLPKTHAVALVAIAIISGVVFQFRTGVELPIYAQFIIDGTFGGILAAGGYSLTKR